MINNGRAKACRPLKFVRNMRAVSKVSRNPIAKLGSRDNNITPRKNIVNLTKCIFN